MRRLQARGVAVIYISHALEEVQALCERYTVLRDGENVGGGALAGVPVERIVSLMVGRDMDDLYPRTARTPGEVVLEINDLAACDEMPHRVTLSLHRGEVVGIAGLVGAGRTELLRAIFGLKPHLRGRGAPEIERRPGHARAVLAGRYGHGQRGSPARGVGFFVVHRGQPHADQPGPSWWTRSCRT